jgi:cysteine-rich repeat protein
MKIATLLTILLAAGAAGAVDLVCTVPAPNATRGGELCELLRQDMQVPLSRWDNDACATEFLRRGLRDYESSSTARESRALVSGNVRVALETFDANHPPIESARCGDGELTTEFGETCDDGNNEPGDGCDEICQPE